VATRRLTAGTGGHGGPPLQLSPTVISDFEAKAMMDVVFIAATIGFFVIALAYVYACEKLRGGEDER
jgi:hypothetical protein